MEEFRNTTDDYQINLFEETKAFKPAFVFAIIAGIIFILTPFLPLSAVYVEGQSVRKSFFSVFCEAISYLVSGKKLYELNLDDFIAYIITYSFISVLIAFLVRFIILLKKVKTEKHLAVQRMSVFYFEFVEVACILYILSLFIFGFNLDSLSENFLNTFSVINVMNLVYISVSFIGILFTFIANWSTSLTRVEFGKALYLFLEMALLCLIFIVTIYTPIITVKINMGDYGFIKLFDVYLFDDGTNLYFFDKNLNFNADIDMVSDLSVDSGNYALASIIIVFSCLLSPCIIFLIAMFMERSLRKLVAPSGKNVLWAFLSSGKYILYSDFNRYYTNKFITYKDYYWYIGTGVFLFFINYVCFPFMSFIDMWDMFYPKYLFCNASSFFLMFAGIILLVYKKIYNKNLKQIK